MNKVLYALGIAVAATFSAHTKSDKAQTPETKTQEIIRELPTVLPSDSLAISAKEI